MELRPADADASGLLNDMIAHPDGPIATTPASQTPEGWLTLSLAQYKAQRYDDCITSAQRALESRPNYAEAFNNICAANNALNRFAAAIDACEHALAIKPDYPLARNNLAYAKSR